MPEDRNNRILILDDEPALLDAYGLILAPDARPQPIVRSSRSAAASALAPVTQPSVYQVTKAQTGESALQLIETAVKSGQPFACGFFDVKLGTGIDGIETIRRAREIDPNLLVVIVSAYQDRAVEEIARIFGEDFSDKWDFLTKPFSRNEILQKANHLVADWDRRRKLELYLERIEKQTEQLIRTERLAAVGTLARGVGHEFGNILTRILGMSEVALLKKDPKEMEGALKTVVQAAERAGVIVRNINGLVRIETEREATDIHGPIREALALVEHEMKNAGVRVQEEFSLSLPPVRCNRVEIGQVFLNLIINALHAMEGKPNSVLTVRTLSEGGGIRVEIQDTGAGIQPEHMGKLFEPLFTTKGDRGTGIGLNVSRKIVTNHSGNISVQSKVGVGTTFRIDLPADPKK